MGEPCEGRTTHHAGCACHEARRDADLAAVTAERDALRADVDRITLANAVPGLITGIVRKILGAVEGEATPTAAQRVTRELAVLRAQQAPLVACVDALRAAARDAGWRDADATGEHLVAWVRRGEREACARIADDEARDSEGNEGAACAAQSIAAKIRGREGGE